ncbi:hypothetical protein [Paenibacillus rigui]|uniref:Uncharacterized protein n=1 Tax=Paenibacillus rigui TaxID=554312 RepID=A0A229UH69_9BACL|nr:hypothetical protein [Paenibacillus rigui]OXM82732.1 hypothetical protein CF651_29110 [Paenibacillus rigui]
MNGIWAWLGLALLIGAGVAVNRLVKSSGPLGQAAAGLRHLVGQQLQGQSTPEDLPLWEKHLAALDQYPSDYNKLNLEIRFIQIFAQYLEQHYPSDERIPAWLEAGSYRKDTVWGIKINRQDEK